MGWLPSYSRATASAVAEQLAKQQRLAVSCSSLLQGMRTCPHAGKSALTISNGLPLHSTGTCLAQRLPLSLLELQERPHMPAALISAAPADLPELSIPETYQAAFHDAQGRFQLLFGSSRAKAHWNSSFRTLLQHTLAWYTFCYCIMHA